VQAYGLVLCDGFATLLDQQMELLLAQLRRIRKQKITFNTLLNNMPERLNRVELGGVSWLKVQGHVELFRLLLDQS
jgi:hypothetical protein